MLKTFKALLGIHDKRDASVGELETALADAQAQADAADHACAEAEAVYRAGLLRLDDDALERVIVGKQAAEVRRDQAAALVAALAERLTGTRDNDAEAELRARYDAAAKAQTAAARMLAVEYPKHARALVELLQTVAQADALAQAVNAALPAGAEPLASVQSQVRREPNVAARVLADETFDAWCRTGGHRLAPDEQANVTPDASGRTGMWKPFARDAEPVERRRFRRVTTLPEATGRDVQDLAATLNLPGLRASHAHFWAAGAASQPQHVVDTITAAAPTWGKSLGPVVLFEPEPVLEVLPVDAIADAA